VEITVTSDGVEGTAVVEVVERARAAWSLPLTGFIKGIAIGEDGTLYVADTQNLHAVGAQGALRWSVPSYLSGGTPAIADDGTLYLGAFSGGLRAIDPDGTVLWVAPIERIWSPAAIGPDGTIYQVNGNGTLHAVDPTGPIEWRFDAPGGLSVNNQPPAVAEDGTIYFGSEDHHLYAIAPDGSERWRFATEGIVRAPSIGTDGTIYFANDRLTEWSDDAGLIVLADSRMFALHPDGTERWSALLGGDVWAGPAIGFDGSIYIGDYVFAPDGSMLREGTGGGGLTPIVASDGSMYRSLGSVTAAGADGTGRWSFQPAGGAGATPAIGFDGSIYAGANVGGETNRLFAFEELDGTHGDYDGSPWPQERSDRANSGRARGGG
jgi:outer membrane protein assembly factor BamB